MEKIIKKKANEVLKTRIANEVLEFSKLDNSKRLKVDGGRYKDNGVDRFVNIFSCVAEIKMDDIVVVRNLIWNGIQFFDFIV